MKLYFSEKIIHIRDFGRSVEYYDLISDPNYPDYTIINNLPTVIENVDLGLCFDGLYDEAIRQIGEKKLSSI